MDMLKVGRLAMRQEGEFWNAYYAQPDTMQDAILLGSIRLRFVATVSRRNHFMKIMQQGVTQLLKETTGVAATWPDGAQPAPEHERTKTA